MCKTSMLHNITWLQTINFKNIFDTILKSLRYAFTVIQIQDRFLISF